MTRRKAVNALNMARFNPRRRSPRLGLLISIGSLAALVIAFVLQNRSSFEVLSVTPATALDDQYRPVEVTDVFGPEDVFFVSVELQGYRPSMPVFARWRYEGSVIAETTLNTDDVGEGFAGFVLINDSPPWPSGRYTVEIVFQEDVLQSTSFRVEP